MPVGYISEGTTVLSNLSLTGLLSASTVSTTAGLTTGAIVGSALSLTGGASLNTVTAASTLSVGGALTATGAVTTVSTVSVGGALTATTSVAVGGGTTITRIAKGTVSIVTMTVGANYSSSTTVAVSGLSTVDWFHLMPPTASGLSAGLVVQAYSSGSGIATVVFSNASAAQTVQGGPGTYPYIFVRS